MGWPGSGFEVRAALAPGLWPIEALSLLELVADPPPQEQMQSATAARAGSEAACRGRAPTTYPRAPQVRLSTVVRVVPPAKPKLVRASG